MITRALTSWLTRKSKLLAKKQRRWSKVEKDKDTREESRKEKEEEREMHNSSKNSDQTERVRTKREERQVANGAILWKKLKKSLHKRDKKKKK